MRPGQPGARFAAVIFGIGLLLTSVGLSRQDVALGPSIDCYLCPGDMLECLDREHDTKETDGGGVTGPLHSCLTGSCESHDHDKCEKQYEEEDVDAEDVTEFVAALRMGDDDALASVLLRLRGPASFNSARQAIQVRGCGNTIVAHIPVSTDSELYRQFADR